MSFSETISPFFGRCAFVWFYMTSAHATSWPTGITVAAELAAKHVPLPPLVLVVALILIFMGCISLLFGYHTRHGAVMLFGITIVATVTLA